MNRLNFFAHSVASGGAVVLGSSKIPPKRTGAPQKQALLEWLSWAEVPGLVLAQIAGSKIETRAAGDAANSRAMNVEALFEAASLSKPVFAYACLELVRHGALELDRPLLAYLPHGYPIYDPRAAKITARHVLSHTTGLQNWRFREDQPLRLAFDPGTRYSYSGEGFYFLQTAVEEITGTGIAGFMRSTVLEPLGMHASSYVWWDGAARNLAVPHDLGGEPSETRTKNLGSQLLTMALLKNKPLETWTTEEVMAALPHLDGPQRQLPVYAFPNVATSLLTTASDYARFLIAIKGAGHAEMFVPQIRINSAISWGLGIGLEKRGSHLAPFHWGDNDGYKNFFVIDLSANRGVVVMTNGDRGLNLAERVAEECSGRRFASSLWIS